MFGIAEYGFRLDSEQAGIIGKVGTIFGRHGVNIAQMTVGRSAPGGHALGILNLALKDPDVLEGEKAGLIVEWDRLLGLGLTEAETSEAVELPDDLKSLLTERAEARKNKDWKRSDAIRDQFRDRGFVLKDNPDGSVSVN